MIIIILLINLVIIVHISSNARFVLHIKCASLVERMNRWDILLFIMLFILIFVHLSRDARFVLHIKCLLSGMNEGMGQGYTLLSNMLLKTKRYQMNMKNKHQIIAPDCTNTI